MVLAEAVNQGFYYFEFEVGRGEAVVVLFFDVDYKF